MVTVSRQAAVWAETREVLIVRVREIMQYLENKDGRIWNFDGSIPVLECNILPCGGGVSYMALADIPYEDVSCPCGDETHWLIKYGKA